MSIRFKLRSSALLVAMSVGIVLSGLVVGIALVTGEYFKLSGQSRDGKAAYRAALSGIDDGLLRYKYATAQAKTGELFGVQNEQINLVNNYSNYKLSYKLDSIRVGDEDLFNSGSLWEARDAAGLDNLLQKGAKIANVDDIIDIDLSYWAKSSTKKIGQVNIYFTDPFIGELTQPTFLPLTPKRYFTAMSYQLINVGDIASGGEKSQLIDEATNTSTASSSVAVSKIGDCMISGTSCHLRVKPLAVSVNSFTGATGERRLNGVTDSAFAKGKKIAYAIEARDSQDGLLEEATTSPGTLIISSVGVAGQATRKIEAKIDLSSGKYLGLFDYGVYCGKECEGLGGANQGG